MDFRDYSLGSLKELSVHFKAVIEASKDEAGSGAYDAAVSKLFRSFSRLVPLRGLRETADDIEKLASGDGKFQMRWNVAEYRAFVGRCRRAIADPSVSKAEIDRLESEADSRIETLRVAKAQAPKLDVLLAEFSRLRPSDYSRGTYAKVASFVEKCASSNDVDEIADLLSLGESVRSGLVDIVRLRKAMFATYGILNSKSFRDRNPETATEMTHRMEYACDIIGKADVKKQEVDFATASLSAFLENREKSGNLISAVRSKISRLFFREGAYQS